MGGKLLPSPPGTQLIVIMECKGQPSRLITFSTLSPK